MILINRNSANYVRLTLTEKCTLTYPYYLFVFTSDITGSSKTFTSLDNSSYPYRYNEFVITETSSEDLSIGRVELKPTGFWSYKVYEMSDSTNLLVSNTTSMIESGRVLVIGNVTNFNKYINNRTYKVYGQGA